MWNFGACQGKRGTALTGDPSGGAFSAGAFIKDEKTHTVDSIGNQLRRFTSSIKERNPFDVVQEFPKPVICAVNGYAIGIGCLIPLCCDFIIASESADFRLPQVNLGILPAYGLADIAAYLLPYPVIENFQMHKTKIAA